MFINICISTLLITIAAATAAAVTVASNFNVMNESSIIRTHDLLDDISIFMLVSSLELLFAFYLHFNLLLISLSVYLWKYHHRNHQRSSLQHAIFKFVSIHFKNIMF